MSLSQKAQEKIDNLTLAIKNFVSDEIIDRITEHNVTANNSRKGHTQAGGVPQTIGTSLSAGTDNGYYARADHVHTVDFANIQNTPNALNVVDDLNTNDGSSPLSAKQGKWLNDNKASYQALNDKNVTVTKLATATTGYIATYEVKQGETSIGKIDIPKDYLVKSGTVETVTVADDPVNGYEIGDKYIDFVINTKDSSGTDEHIYINVKDLVEDTTYTADNNTLQLSNNNQFSIKSGGVTSSHIANGTITGDNISSNAAIDFSKLNISKSNIVGLGIPAQDTTYTPASATPLTENYVGAVGTETKYAREDHRHPIFDYIDSGTAGATGYVETIQIKVNGSYQDSPIKIEIFQRQSTQNSILFVRFENIASTDPAIGSFYHSGSNNSGFWLYKKSTGTYSLIVKKAGTEAHDGIRLKITNPNANIAISNINSQLANLPSDTTTNPLLQSTYIGLESTATNIKMNGTQSAGSLTTYARADHVHPVDTSRATSGHGHGNITNGGAISGAASKNVVTDANGKITTENKPTNLPPTFTHIPASSDSTQDLNSSTYKVGGFYYCGHDKNEAPYISNCPLSGTNNRGFFLLVETWGTTSSYVKQTLTYYTTNKTYTRTCGGGTWGAWKEFAAANHTHSYISTAAGSVGASNLASNAVTTAKIADSNVTTAKIADNAVTNDKILNNTITSAKLANKTITGDKIDGQTIFAYNLADLNVTTEKISDSAVTSAKIKDETIVNGDISSSAAIAYSKLSGVAPTNHNHSTWTEKQTYTSGNKKIHLYVNEQLRLCDLYWENVSALNANTNLAIASDGWLTSTYRPSHPAVGGGAYAGITTVGRGGGINYRIPITISSNTIYGQAMWHY